MSNPLDTQVGGSHYTSLAIQPVRYIYENGLPFIEGNIVKYISRWQAKGGIEDLQKVKHYVELLIQFEQEKASKLAKATIEEGFY